MKKAKAALRLSPIPRESWHSYRLQSLIPSKFAKVVGRILSDKYSLIAPDRRVTLSPEDEGNKIASRFGLAFGLPDDLRELYSSFGIDLERYNGDDSWTLPIPARFILDKEGIIVSMDANPDYTKRPEPHEILEILSAHSS